MTEVPPLPLDTRSHSKELAPTPDVVLHINPAEAFVDTKIPFESPIRVQTGNSVKDVQSVRDACDVLIDWPHARRGPFYQSAREVVEAALNGRANAQEAREAFLALISHAGVLVD